MENETQGQTTSFAIKDKMIPGIFQKIAGFWKSNAKAKTICFGAVLVLLALPLQSGCGKSDGIGSDWKYTDESFATVFSGFPKDEGMVYKHAGSSLKVMQSTKNGNLVEYGSSDRVVWVETKRRYEDGEPLDAGYYIRRGSMEYRTALGAEKRVARYVEVTAAAEAKLKAEAEVIAKAKAEIAKLGIGKTAGERKTLALPGGATMEMVWCPPGTFMMGSPEDEEGREAYGETQHEVTLTKGFWMAKTEVTQVQWTSVMGNNPSDNKGDDLPVDTVSWDDCQAFCEKLGLQLPTDAQWEYACRAGSTGPYAGTGNLDEMGWYDDNSDFETHPVGKKHPNAWGFYDMHGNVEEWCSEYPSDAVTNPNGTGSGGFHMLCGGFSGSCAQDCRSAYRGHFWVRGSSGFRPVTLSEAPVVEEPVVEAVAEAVEEAVEKAPAVAEETVEAAVEAAPAEAEEETPAPAKKARRSRFQKKAAEEEAPAAEEVPAAEEAPAE